MTTITCDQENTSSFDVMMTGEHEVVINNHIEPTGRVTPKPTTPTSKIPTPYTGDHFNVWAWIALLGVGVVLAGSSVYFLKKR